MAYDIGGGGGKFNGFEFNSQFALAKPYELSGTMTPEKMANADEMFQQLYQSVQQLANAVAASGALSDSVSVRQIGITVDGGGAEPSVGIKGYRSCPWSGTVTQVRLLADTPGSVAFAVAQDTYPNYPPTTVVISPYISGAQKAQWSVSLPVKAGDVFGFAITSVTTITRVTLELTIVSRA